MGTSAPAASADSAPGVPLPVAASLTGAPRPEVEAYDTVPPASIRINEHPLVQRRVDVIRRLGAADSTFGFTDDIASCLRAADTAAVYEVYDRAVYLRRGGRLQFMQSWPVGAEFSVEVGNRRIRRGDPLTALQRLFPVSYQHRITLADPRYQSLVICPPAKVADDEQYEFVLFEGRVVQFKRTLICDYHD
ncbi:hypothetical protein [Hymenobacter cellulosivorans]|uniref:Uncharacterized protein n=1 Tax=Hymenobacter cellulosivorans TaxID=2932249 RepID=A0ABY4F627_9BACT|nr:hypothetical protein [Hymenobacter cellulosivorans]UOQ52035.1 hypothetical protein MUN80_20005 [Hymenobacter cellulosivorans]